MKGGVFRIDPDSAEIKNYQVDPEKPGNLPDDRVSAIYQGQNGTVWIGKGNGWLANYDPVNDEFVPVEDVSVQIVSLNEDQAGNLWIGTHTMGIFSLNISQGVLTNYPYVDPAQSSDSMVFSSHIITSIFVDQAGNQWIGTYLGGINLWTGDWITHYRHDPYNKNNLSHNHVLLFYEEMRGINRVMWIDTMGGGLNRLDIDIQTFAHSPTPGEILLVGYGLGVVKFNTDLINGLEIWGYSGNAPGYAAGSLYLPEFDISIGTMVNTKAGEAMFTIIDLLTVLAEEL
jgi:hypothetical protein